MEQQIKITTDGSHTIYVPELDEHYHSVHGAIQESEHIFIGAGYGSCQADPVRILEIGFGTGLNAFLTAIRCGNDSRKVNYTGIEKYPLDNEIVKQLNYFSFPGFGNRELFEDIHGASWEVQTDINETFTLLKKKTDMLSFVPEGTYDLIYFDAFGPDKQPEMWSGEIIARLGRVTPSGGIFVTYSVKGELKRNLRANGFRIELLPGPPGKRQMMRAIKI